MTVGLHGGEIEAFTPAHCFRGTLSFTTATGLRLQALQRLFDGYEAA